METGSVGSSREDLALPPEVPRDPRLRQEIMKGKTQRTKEMKQSEAASQDKPTYMEGNDII